jgi:hypothetical protein
MARVAARQPELRPTGRPVAEVLDSLPPRRRDEAEQLIELMGRVTGETPVVWGGAIVGFGSYRYRYPSGTTGDAPLISFASTARHQAIYLVGDFAQRHARQLESLGAVRAGKGCLYVTRLRDVDLDALSALVDRSVRVRRGVDRAARR